MTPKTTPNANVLVAIAKIETKLDILTVDVKDLKDGMKSDIEFLKVDKISRAEAVRIQTDSMTKQGEVEDKVDENSKRITNLEDSRIAYRASLKVWVILGGGIWSFVLIGASIFIGSLLK